MVEVTSDRSLQGSLSYAGKGDITKLIGHVVSLTKSLLQVYPEEISSITLIPDVFRSY